MIIDNFTIDGTTVIPNPEESATEELSKLQIEDTVYSVGSGGGNTEYTILYGDMSATYGGTTPSYALPLTRTPLPEGLHFRDYDEICVVSIPQMTVTADQAPAYFYNTIPIWALDHKQEETNGICFNTVTGANVGTRVSIFEDDTFINNWYNYASPIAILGIKH